MDSDITRCVTIQHFNTHVAVQCLSLTIFLDLNGISA